MQRANNNAIMALVKCPSGGSDTIDYFEYQAQIDGLPATMTLTSSIVVVVSVFSHIGKNVSLISLVVFGYYTPPLLRDYLRIVMNVMKYGSWVYYVTCVPAMLLASGIVMHRSNNVLEHLRKGTRDTIAGRYNFALEAFVTYTISVITGVRSDGNSCKGYLYAVASMVGFYVVIILSFRPYISVWNTASSVAKLVIQTVCAVVGDNNEKAALCLQLVQCSLMIIEVFVDLFPHARALLRALQDKNSNASFIDFESIEIASPTTEIANPCIEKSNSNIEKTNPSIEEANPIVEKESPPIPCQEMITDVSITNVENLCNDIAEVKLKVADNDYDDLQISL